MTYFLLHLIRRAAVEAFSNGYRENGFINALIVFQGQVPSNFPEIRL